MTISDSTTTIVEEEVAPPDRPLKKLHLGSDFKLVQLEEIEIQPNPEDSLSYHMSFNLDDTKILTVAQPLKETFEGVRMQVITKKKNGKMKLIDSSSPGYDSPMLFPTFFKNDRGEYIVLANTGENDSWGAKVYSIINNHFQDLGFVDMAVVEKREFPAENGRMDRYTNIAKHTKIRSENGNIVFTFSGNKMILFEDNNKKHDVKFGSGEYDYIFDNESFVLRKK